MSAIELHLVRHGRVDGAGTGTVYGQSDVALSAVGARESRTVAAWLAERVDRPVRVFGSDLTRCRGLGDDLARRVGVAYEPVPELREQSMGAWEGRAWSELRERDTERVDALWSNYASTAPPGGESFGDVAQRVVRWWTEVAATVTDGSIVVVTHAGVVRALCGHFLGVPLDQALRLAPAYASVTTLRIASSGAVLETFGVTPQEPSSPA